MMVGGTLSGWPGLIHELLICRPRSVTFQMRFSRVSSWAHLSLVMSSGVLTWFE
jgi:hypothetical protein